MNIVIPAAGAGSRFVAAGYSVPKPFIPVKGKPMVEHVVDNISTSDDCVYIVCLLEHLPYLTTTTLLHRGNVAIIPQVGRLRGATETVLLARQFIDNSEPLVIANSDQWIKFDQGEFRRILQTDRSCILTFPSDNPKWSYAEVNEKQEVLRVAEKEVISNHATVGVYGFSSGWRFLHAADRMIAANDQVRGEFYVCPVFNHMTEYVSPPSKVPTRGIRALPVEAMYGMGTPEDLEQNYNYVGL